MYRNAIAVVVLSVSMYVPPAGGINGGECYGKPWQNCRVQTGDAACGSKYAFGTVFVMPEWTRNHGIPHVLECNDRGGAVTNRHLDVAKVSGNVKSDLNTAISWGRREVGFVIVYASMDAYLADERLDMRLAAIEDKIPVKNPIRKAIRQ